MSKNAARNAPGGVKEAVALEKVFISKDDQYWFGQGNHYEIYKKLGAHPSIEKGQKGFYFAVWAPNAKSVSVVGEFNGWDPMSGVMKKTDPDIVGIWEKFIPGVESNQMYKFFIIKNDGSVSYKADPYASYSEMRPGNASRTFESRGFTWTDEKWMKERADKDLVKSPMAIYEVHMGSWMRHPRQGDASFYTYREFADRLVEYLREMRFTHVELMGIAEYPFDGSWGYQVTGYFAPTSRYGDPDDFRYLVNLLHRNHIGIILDWVPAHFPRDEHGLANFDGTALYEYADPRKGEHPDWGTKIFDYSKNEVKNFLINSALYWVEQFHVDGLRVDAVASMLYLDYGKRDGEWVANKFGGNKNLDAIEFFKHLNSVLLGRNHGAMMIAEESTAWPKVTAPPEDDGLGFSFKWNMGWMHDFCDYMSLDPYFRKDNHYKMTFAMSYNGAENYILVLSHDEVVHLKRSMLEKMPGTKEQKFANLRAGYGFMLTHAGKKLLFMGQEFGQEREWSEERELDWFLLEDPAHRKFRDYSAELLKIYNNHPALWEQDASQDGFYWINADDTEKSLYSFARYNSSEDDILCVVVNFTPVERPEYRMGVPLKGAYTLVLNSDEERFGGAGAALPKTLTAEKIPWDGQAYSIGFKLPPFGAVIYKLKAKDDKRTMWDVTHPDESDVPAPDEEEEEAGDGSGKAENTGASGVSETAEKTEAVKAEAVKTEAAKAEAQAKA